MKQPPTQNKMGTMPVGKLLVNMALPLIISMLVQALYNVVDSIYVSRISESAVTALSLAFPVQNLMIGFATGVGVGVNSLLSRSLGEQNQDRANRAAGNGVILSVTSILLFMVFGLFFSGVYYSSQSTVAETVIGGTSYIRICTVFSAGIFIEILGERLLQASGRTFYSMITQGVGAIINIVFDPIFIFGWFGLPKMGIAGAAVATVLGQWVAGILAIIFNFRVNHDVQFSLSALKPKKFIITQILNVGVPSIIMVGIGSIMVYGMNHILQGFSETATGVFGIYYKLQSFFLMPLFGLNNAAVSIVAYNYGARKPKRITGTIKRACGVAFSIMMVGLLIFQFAPELVLNIFNPSPDFMAMGRSALRVISIHFPLAAFGIVLSATFQAMGIGVYSTINSLCRQLIVLLPAAWLLSLTGDVHNVWWSFPIAELVSLTVTLLLFRRVYRQKIKPMFQATQTTAES